VLACRSPDSFHETSSLAQSGAELCVSGCHVSFISYFRPDRYTSNEAALAALKLDGKQRFFEMLRYVESRLPDQGYLLGERYSLCDAYLAVFHLWAKRIELSTDELVRSRSLLKAVLKRAAVRRALEQEGFGQLFAAGAA
jgi:glutathione S-transferase